MLTFRIWVSGIKWDKQVDEQVDVVHFLEGMVTFSEKEDHLIKTGKDLDKYDW